MKKYNVMYNVGTTKYLVNIHNGKEKHKDGSNFYGIECFKSKKALNAFIMKIHNEGYIYGHG